MSGKKGMTHYPVEKKQETIRLFFEEGQTRSEIADRLGLRDQDCVKKWVRQYRREGDNMFSKHIGRPYKKAETQESELKRLRMENTLLKKLRSELRKDILAKRDIGPFITSKRNTK